jgi:hypothetical protein
MPRTTLDIDASVLAELKELQRREGRSLGELASELLARALRSRKPSPSRFSWTTKPMAPRVDLEDKEAVHAALDES